MSTIDKLLIAVATAKIYTPDAEIKTGLEECLILQVDGLTLLTADAKRALRAAGWEHRYESDREPSDDTFYNEDERFGDGSGSWFLSW